MKLKWWPLALLLLALAACQRQPEPVEIEAAPARPFVFDTDMAHEDMIAALFLLQHPHVDLLALTVVGTGEAHCEPGVDNALDLLMLAGQPEIPVSCGRETPLGGNAQFPAAWRQAADAAYGVPLPDNPSGPSDRDAPALLAETILASTEPVTVVAVGPLTNLAEAFRENPNLVENITAIYIMGGAVEVDGNVGRSGVGINNEKAEWNIYIDPLAANLVLDAGAPVVIVPLDATSDVPVSMAFVQMLGDREDAATAALFAHEILSTQTEFIEAGGFQFWDSFTAAVAVDGSLAELETMPISVVEEAGPQRGWTFMEDGATPVSVALSANRTAFEGLLLAVLSREKP